MAPSATPEVYNFHQDETLHTSAQNVSKWQSFRNLTAAVWKNRAAFRGAGLVAASKDVIPDIPLNDPVNGLLTRGVVHYLWGSMLHPPLSFRGPKHQYRTADGSHHNALFPDLGKAGLPYAKSVQGQRATLGAKPDPGDLFDLLMARPDNGRESETGISSFLLYQATIVIHDIFRTNDSDRNKSDTSSYLDLAPLYGSSQEAQNSVRTLENGLLKPDTFADHRLLNQPPGVSIFLIMYNRFHNYAAKQLLEINENGRFSLPADFDKLDAETQAKCRLKRDDDLFQTARLITCGLYAQIAIHDYLRCLMMMHAKDTSWTLDPRAEYNGLLDRGALKRGEGNMVSVEFNLLYRFHSAISRRDANWSTNLLKLWMGDKVSDKEDKETKEKIEKGELMTTSMLENGDIPTPIMMAKIREANREADEGLKGRLEKSCFPEEFDLAGFDFSDPKKPKRVYVFQRNAEGYFDDGQLVAELVRSIEDPMCSFGAQQIPKAFKSIEILGILQSRKWEVATLNEFRTFFGMKRHERFEDITTDPVIQDRLRDLYEDPDMVELYPGYLCEGSTRNLDPTESCPGSGATALWRGVFSDAVTLVRSDRFYTTDWNVDSITAWGMSEVASDPSINKGGLLHRVCQRAFPGYFSYNSLHLWEPYYTPAKNLVLAEEQGYLDRLDLSGLEYQFEVEGSSNHLWLTLETDLVQKRSVKALLVGQKGRFRVRRQLQPSANITTKWGSVDIASKIAVLPEKVNDYITIKDEILDGKHTLWANPSIAHPSDIPEGPLRLIMTDKYQRWNEAMDVLKSSLGQDEKKLQTHFIEYFSALAGGIRLREQRSFQKAKDSQIVQLDLVKNFVIPISVRFMVDLIGIWDRIKTPEAPNREFSENDIFRLIEDCQNYQA